MRACKCPGCGAELNIDDNNRDFAFCQYCGAKSCLMITEARKESLMKQG